MISVHCFCRKHHCAVHPVPTNTLMMDPKLKQMYNPVTNYNDKFPPRVYQCVERRGLAVPARILPRAPPAASMDLLSMSCKDFVEKPLNLVGKVVAENNLKIPKAPFQDSTTYKSHYYPTIATSSSPVSKSLMKTTMPRIVEVKPDENYLTTNQCTLKKWSGSNRSVPYKELQEPPFFTGKFQKKTVTSVDYSGTAVKGGKPSTTCKKQLTWQAPEEGFDGCTTNKMAYKLPIIGQRGPMHIKGRSQVMEETMEPSTGKVESLTQYRRDNPGFLFKTSRRTVPQPQLEKLVLFRGPLINQSEQRVSFKEPSMPPLQRIQSGYSAVEKASRDKIPQRRIDGKPDSINKTEYFQFWETTPRVRHGDNSERVYRPSEQRFVAESETSASFPPIAGGKASKVCEPLDVRFGNKAPKHGHTFSGQTAYNGDYTPRPLPKAEVCPAEAVLQKA